ncbi:MAG TPA: hypothetical protein VFC46_17915, partial [Humisphaera sp.]|nr:hypothetical protein [Humisphaera sp.]
IDTITYFVGLVSIKRTCLRFWRQQITILIYERRHLVAKLLSYLERGDLYEERLKDGLSIRQIAKTYGVNERHVRRCLELSSAPDDVRRTYETGKLNFTCLLEIAKLDDETRKAALNEFLKDGKDVSLAKIKAFAKGYNRGEPAAPHTPPNKKTGKARAAGIAAWKGRKVIESRLAKLCYFLLNAEDKGTSKWHEIRGAIGMAMWQRGDLPDPIMSPHDPAESDNPGEAKIELERINEFIEAHASKHTPDAQLTDEEADLAGD